MSRNKKGYTIRRKPYWPHGKTVIPCKRCRKKFESGLDERKVPMNRFCVDCKDSPTWLENSYDGNMEDVVYD